MLSFELSAIDLILAVAVIILLVLHLTKSSAKPPTEEKLLVEKERPSEKPVTEAAIPEEDKKRVTSTGSQPQTGSSTCHFSFGYLAKRDKDAPIPEGCLSCSRIMGCYSANE